MNACAESKKKALIDKLFEMGYEADPRGNLVCTAIQECSNGNRVRRKYRFKFQDISVRLEVQGLEKHPVYGTYPWLRITSCYYTQIVDCKDGRMRVGSMLIGTRDALQPA